MFRGKFSDAALKARERSSRQESVSTADHFLA